MERQLKGHLGIEPGLLAVAHLEELARWCHVSSSLVIDKDKSEAFRDRIRYLSADGH